MTDALNGQILNSGTGAPPLAWEYRRPTADTTTSYVDAGLQLRVYVMASRRPNARPLSETPDLTLAIGLGLNRTLNDAAEQAGVVVITPAQLQNLLGDNNIVQCSYYWVINPIGFEEFTAFGDGTYDGRFFIVAPGFAGVGLDNLPRS